MSWSGRDLNLLRATEKAIFLDNAIIACVNKQEMINNNIDKVKANMLPIAPIVADSNCDAAKSHSADQAAGLPMKTIISKNTNFRMTSKLWTEAGQTNDSDEVINFIIYDGQSEDEIDTQDALHHSWLRIEYSQVAGKQIR